MVYVCVFKNHSISHNKILNVRYNTIKANNLILMKANMCILGLTKLKFPHYFAVLFLKCSQHSSCVSKNRPRKNIC